MCTRTIALLTALPLVLCSCIEFEHQELTYEYSPGKDRLLIFQNYQGIFGAPTGEEDKEAFGDMEIEQLESVMGGEKTFFFSNWIYEFNARMLREYLDEKPKNLSPGEAALDRENRKLCGMLLENVTVQNGEFYLDRDRRLSGYQYVTVTNVSELITQANRTLNLAVPNWVQEEPDFREEHSKGTAKILLDATRQEHEWIRLEEGRISVALPMTLSAFRYMKRILARSIAVNARGGVPDEDEKKTSEPLRIFEGILSSHVSLCYEDSMFRILLGEGRQGAAVRLRMEVFSGYSPNAVDFVRQAYGIAEYADTSSLRSGFFSTGQTP